MPTAFRLRLDAAHLELQRGESSVAGTKTREPGDFSSSSRKWRLPVAGTILVYVPKLRFSSKYSDGHRSPQKLKFTGTPKERRVDSIAHEKSPKLMLGALKVAATYSPTTQCSTIGDAVSLPYALVPLCSAALRSLPRPRAAGAHTAAHLAPLMHFSQPNDHPSLMTT